MVHDHDAIGDLEGFLLIVGDEDAGDVNLVVQPAQPLAQLLAHLRVERAERLVEQQHLRRGGQRAGQGDALALAAGELRRHLVAEALELDQAQQLVDALRRSSGCFHFRTRRPKAMFSNTVMWRNSA